MEEKLNMCSNGSSGTRSAAKKIKQSKVPQRGLGVEKLERIRLEEQRKNGTIPSAATASAPATVPAPVLAVPIRPSPHLYQSLPSVQILRPSIPYPSVSRSNLSCVQVQPSYTSLYTPNTNPTTSSSNVGSALGWPPGSLTSGGFSSSLNSENMKLETGLFDGSSLHMPTDFKPTWPPNGLSQWRQHNQPQFSSLMNTPSSSSTSTAVNFKIEPSSIQNTYGNYSSYLHNFYKEDKMIGMKRSWPFSLDCLSDPSLQCNEPFGNGTSIARDNPSSSTSQTFNWKEISCELKPKKRNREDGTLDGGFLSFGLPANTTLANTSKSSLPFSFPPPDYQELSKIDVLSFQEYSFFPSMEQHIGEASNNSKSEVGSGVDLTLKL